MSRPMELRELLQEFVADQGLSEREREKCRVQLRELDAVAARQRWGEDLRDE